jgi:ADP-heptose:LPS heptosyltransferase
MSSAMPRSSRVAILLGGGVREALMAQPVVRACEGATVFATADAVGALLGLPSMGRTVVVDDSPREVLRVFARLRSGPMLTVVLPYPARFVHAALAYFAGVPRRLMLAGPNDWAASERVRSVHGMHPAEANWRLAAAVSHRPLLASDDPPTLHPPDAVRGKLMGRWPAFTAGRRPLLLIPGRGGWSRRRSAALWPAERFAVTANQSAAEQVVLLSGAGDEGAVRETRGGIAKPTMVLKLSDLTVDEVAVLAQLSSAVIGHDGDAVHVCAAAGATVLVVVRRPDIPPLGERVTPLWVKDFDRLPARQVVDALAKQARIDTYA